MARAAGWRVLLKPRVGSRRANARIAKGDYQYLVELKSASEGRRDRLVPSLAQAILEARSLAASDPLGARPLAVVLAPQIPEPVVRALVEFAAEHASDVAIGIVDREGRRLFVGPGLESLNAEPDQELAPAAAAAEPSIELFSDLNPNPASYLVQKLSIHDRRRPSDRAKDVLYIHDTIELFARSLPELHQIWRGSVAPTLHARTSGLLLDRRRAMFGAVNDTVREAALMATPRRLTPSAIQERCWAGLERLPGPE